ncbi:GNAT family N-acetyltransferase [Amycolatopsis sp. NPDC004169]|uniref:GNAT family N-acetyltransferase n=1 Tax=Amycolatopsis sp. NPDC004169 TaxID=3154453 RepID=UPI0033AB10C0
MTALPHLRPYHPDDRPALFDVCVRTGHEGGDARGVYPDPDLLPAVFLAPYLELEPELASVLDDGGGTAVGYLVGTADTAAFAARFRTGYLPGVAARFPAPDGEPATPAEQLRALLHTPEAMVRPELAGHPAHLHIDILPSHQRGGHGRALIETSLAVLAGRGVPGVHLAVAKANGPARKFYDRLGFRDLGVADPAVTYLGRAIPRGA